MWGMEPDYIPILNVIPYYTVDLRIDDKDIFPERIDTEVREGTDFCLGGI